MNNFPLIKPKQNKYNEIVILGDTIMDLNKFIAVYPDFPKPGISFKDISPLLKNPEAFKYAVTEMAKLARPYKPTLICGPESRAFLFGAALAQELGIGFVMARKPGKLPGKTVCESYDLEYGQASLYVQENSFSKTDRVLLIDDLVATGGTLCALKNIIIKQGATPVAVVTPIRLYELEGEKRVGLPVHALLNLSDSH